MGCIRGLSQRCPVEPRFRWHNLMCRTTKSLHRPPPEHRAVANDFEAESSDHRAMAAGVAAPVSSKSVRWPRSSFDE